MEFIFSFLLLVGFFLLFVPLQKHERIRHPQERGKVFLCQSFATTEAAAAVV